MSRRIDVELTSSREDGSWTWRAAGARQPKGVLDGALLPAAAAVGDVLRADVETDIDGTTVVAVLPPKEKKVDPDRLEIIASSTPLGCRAPAARHVQEPSSRLLVSSTSILRDMVSQPTAARAASGQAAGRRIGVEAWPCGQSVTA